MAYYHREELDKLKEEVKIVLTLVEETRTTFGKKNKGRD
jgi:hypothetical protein